MATRSDNHGDRRDCRLAWGQERHEKHRQIGRCAESPGTSHWLVTSRQSRVKRQVTSTQYCTGNKPQVASRKSQVTEGRVPVPGARVDVPVGRHQGRRKIHSVVSSQILLATGQETQERARLSAALEAVIQSQGLEALKSRTKEETAASKKWARGMRTCPLHRKDWPPSSKLQDSLAMS